ncbi:unnamed protein product [Rhizoctonia solani]|uniref:Uncharacterized protein n=2 Tax=Rhizoctonia solani TaxID=456999 RepID=A0A8H3B3I5_9AGAM|nr:unnamed protein product [Rhizoctonia solani]CAE6446648.1 unnamed protein product [Rhizoctonia solani]
MGRRKRAAEDDWGIDPTHDEEEDELADEEEEEEVETSKGKEKVLAKSGSQQGVKRREGEKGHADKGKGKGKQVARDDDDDDDDDEIEARQLRREIAEMQELLDQHRIDLNIANRAAESPGAGPSRSRVQRNHDVNNNNNRVDNAEVPWNMLRPAPKSWNDLPIKTFKGYLGLKNRKKDRRMWLEWRGLLRGWMTGVGLDINLGWKLQQKEKINRLATMVWNRIRPFRYFARNWGAMYLIKGAFRRRRGHRLSKAHKGEEDNEDWEKEREKEAQAEKDNSRPRNPSLGQAGRNRPPPSQAKHPRASGVSAPSLARRARDDDDESPPGAGEDKDDNGRSRKRTETATKRKRDDSAEEDDDDEEGTTSKRASKKRRQARDKEVSGNGGDDGEGEGSRGEGSKRGGNAPPSSCSRRGRRGRGGAVVAASRNRGIQIGTSNTLPVSSSTRSRTNNVKQGANNGPDEADSKRDVEGEDEDDE